MKKLFIYYSLTGNGDLIVDYCKKYGYDIEKIVTKEPLPKNYILRIITGGYKAMINYEDKIMDLNCDIDEYDEITIGSPIWNDRLSSPVNTVLNILNFKDKKLNFILYSGSGKTKKATEMINKKYSKAKIIILKEPKNNIKELKKLNCLLINDNSNN